MTWPCWWDGDPEGPVQTAYNIRGLPGVYVLDHEGIIRFMDVRGKDLDAAVDKLLAEYETSLLHPAL